MQKQYYLGLDIGTNSVGYAVTNTDYTLMKFKGEPMWGAHLFEEASVSADRRAFRTARRRLDRRQQRVHLLEELFAPEIGKIDPNFFIRRKESSLYEEDTRHGVKIFAGDGMTDAQYHTQYPTIHHLISELMNSTQPHDVRLVYIACAWLVANRGHFLFDISADNISEILDFDEVYQSFCKYFAAEGYSQPWSGDITAAQILSILQKDCGVKMKEEAFRQTLYNGEKISKEADEDFPFSRAAIVALLAGGKVKPADIFVNEADYADIESVSLVMNDEDFARIVGEIDGDVELLYRLRALKDCAQLVSSMNNCACISDSKVEVYNQHQRDLKMLKSFVKKYLPAQYNDIFRNAVKDNYVCYTRNVKSLSEKERKDVKSTASKEDFSDFLLKRLKAVSVREEDSAAYQTMIMSLQARTFLPKQKDTDNRVIPQQLYRYELQEVLNHAQTYLPMLLDADGDGITTKDKILSIFDFKIPYFVGPLHNTGRNNAWLVRKQEGKILPWNFEQMVDFDASEQGFIKRMTNRCTYLPDEDVLPVNSLLYSKFMVLNEINNIKVNNISIPVSVKQELYTNLFERYPRITRKKIEEYLRGRGYMTKEDELSGLDNTVKSSLKSYHIFKRLLESAVLTQAEVEEIIRHAAYAEDKTRLKRWLTGAFPQLSEEDAAYIVRQKLKEFGRLSGKLLNGLYGCRTDSDTGEAFTVLDAMWETNDNLMQVLSDKYTFAEQIKEICAERAGASASLNKRLDEMYVSNAVKRPIYRTLDIIQDVVKANGCAPQKIFVEMARGGTPDQKGQRTSSRKQQLLELYKKIKTDEIRQLQSELEAMGEMADNRLQSDRLFLYYLQLGKSAYTGKPIDLTRLGDGTYNLEHIYPQCHVKDDSVLNNLVLVESEINGLKSDSYPLPADIRRDMVGFWHMLKETGLMREEKYRRLMRTTGFTAEERMGFINRQLVETRQSTKVIKDLLQQMYPDTEIVPVKAGLVSEFRQEFDLLKCRSVNDLHHAKDAYLNIVVGNVYNERFTKRWFSLYSQYNVQVGKIFKQRQCHGDRCYWNGEADIAAVKKTAQKNAVHLTRYAFCRKGGLFDQQPLPKGDNLIPLKAGLPTEKYGGYNKATATFFVLARFTVKKKREIMVVPISLLYADKFRKSTQDALTITASEIEKISGKSVDDLELLLGGRALKVNTVLSLDGTLVTIAGKTGRQILISPLLAVKMGYKWEVYIKALERFLAKQKLNKAIVLDEKHDHITRKENEELYALLTEKMGNWPFSNLPSNQAKTMKTGTAKFAALDTAEQVTCLTNIISLFNAGAGGADLRPIGGSAQSGVTLLSMNVSNWKKNYSDVRIIDRSASGMFESHSENLLELL